MSKSTPDLGEAPRSGLVVALLLVSLVLTGTLAWQAQVSARSHRAVAEALLRDYASLAAGEMVRRASSQVGYYGYATLIDDLRRRAPESGPPPSPEELAADGDEGVLKALPLLAYTFRFEPEGARLLVEGEVAPALRQELRSHLSKLIPEAKGLEGRFAIRHGRVGEKGPLYTLVFCIAKPVAESGGPPVLLGFGVHLDALSEVFTRTVEQGPLLPSALGGGEIGNEILSLSVLDADGRVVYASRDAGERKGSELGAEVPFGATYGSVLDGWVVRVSVDPESAPRLIIGGLPRSRLPLLLGLMALAAGLVAVALRQVRREKELAVLRSDFVSRVSHELRTPLSQIRMFAETLLFGRVRSSEEQRRALEIIDRESRRLSHLVENILQFSRSERGGLRLAPQPQSLAPFVEEVVGEVRPLMGRVNVELRLDPGLEALVDGDGLRQVLLNLLDNACKYGPPGQTVTVGLSTAGPRRLRLWVEDEGPGVPRGEEERIWRRFHRLERDRRSAVAGTGIGLAVVRDLVTHHGGETWVEPGTVREGRTPGARFVVELPRLQREAEASEARPLEVTP